MKKLLVLTLAFGLFLGGCGGPTPKEEAKTIHDKYASATSTLNQLAVKQAGLITDLTPSKISELEKNNVLIRQEIEKAKNEKVSDDVKACKDAIVMRGEKLVEIVDCSIAMKKAETNNDKSSVNKYRVQRDNAMKSLSIANFNINNEIAKIVTGKPIATMTINDNEYICSTVSDVAMCVTNYKMSAKPISDGFSTPIAPIGKFVYVTIAVYNDQKDAISVDANNFKIIYKGREYSHHPIAQFTYDVEQKTSMNTRLNPGMGMEHTYIFDVPKDFSNTDAQLQARGGFTGDTVLLRIPATKKPK